MPVRSTTQTSWWSPAQSRAAKWACSVQFVFIWRAARIGADRCGPGELIQEPSWGAVLSAFSAAVIAGVGDLRQTLEGLVQKGRGARATEVRPPAFCPAAELFTSSGGAVFPDRFPRWRITPESVSVQTLSRLRNRVPCACASCSLQPKHTRLSALLLESAVARPRRS